jgi:arylsulfatase A-like enzyme
LLIGEKAMIRREFINTVSMAAFSSLICGCNLRTKNTRPNILLIMSDDMGYSDIGCFGGEINTPNIDKLANKGIRFTQFYNTSRCCPTRASLLTGLYPHQTGIGFMTDEWSVEFGEGYARDLNKKCITIAEALKPAGYRNYAIGKWHVAHDFKPNGPKHNWPLQRGFDKFYGTIIGANSYYDPGTLTRDNQAISPFADKEYQPETYYYTNAISDHAVRYINEHSKEGNDDPFFMYVAYTTAHWPMQALEKDIVKYKGHYDAGYEKIREARVRKMMHLGLIDPKWKVSDIYGDWEHAEYKEFEIRNMEVYAAMIDCMDQGIGRIYEALKQNNKFDNTLIIFLQDNGGCHEDPCTWNKTPDKMFPPIPKDVVIQDMIPKQTRKGKPVLSRYDLLSGPEETYVGYRQAWANVSNTPFRMYKHWVHEGGISTPLIVHWPNGIPVKVQGRMERQPGHIIDIMATCVELAEAEYPNVKNENHIYPLEGVSLVPLIFNKNIKRNKPIFFEHEGNRAIRDGKWKLVADGPHGEWELYDMENDRTEMNNLAENNPEIVNELAQEWENWAIRTKVKPWPWK